MLDDPKKEEKQEKEERKIKAKEGRNVKRDVGTERKKKGRNWKRGGG